MDGISHLFPIGNEPQSTKNPHGVIVVNGMNVADTKQCCHCDGHFIVQKGSGRKRGWCKNCHEVHCGGPKCWVCVPFEKKMDLLEAGKILEL